MQHMTKSLSDFINEFELIESDIGVCFEASIYANLHNVLIEIESDVQIVSRSNISTIYLLNPNLQANNIPHTFEASESNLSFRPSYGLVIRDEDVYNGRYALMIVPVNKNCLIPTFDEIRAKTYN